MKQLLAALLVALCTSTFAEDPSYAKLFIGTIDTFKVSQDSQYGLEYEFGKGLTRFNFKQAIGIIRTRDESHLLYSSFNRTSKFTNSDVGLALTFSAGSGIYLHGGGEDTNLGSWFELRTSAGLLWIFSDDTRLGLHLAHLSNASISDVNPGTELITLTYELPF